MTDSTTVSTTSEIDEEDLGEEDLGGLDDLLASLRTRGVHF